MSPLKLKLIKRSRESDAFERAALNALNFGFAVYVAAQNTDTGGSTLKLESIRGGRERCFASTVSEILVELTDLTSVTSDGALFGIMPLSTFFSYKRTAEIRLIGPLGFDSEAGGLRVRPHRGLPGP